MPKNKNRKDINYEKQQVREQEETNTWLKINTIFTVISGIAQIAIAIVGLLLVLQK